MAFFSKVLRASSAAATTATTGATGTAFTIPDGVGQLGFVLNVTAAATEAGDTLDVYIDGLDPDGNWVNLIHFPQILGNGGAKKFMATLTSNETTVTIVSVAADAAANTARALGFPFHDFRYREAYTDVATTSNMSFTWGLTAIGRN